MCTFCFRKNLSIHGGLFRSCGPPLDPDSGKIEDCPTFEEVLGGIIQRPLVIGRALLISTIVIHFIVLLLSLGMFKYLNAAKSLHYNHNIKISLFKQVKVMAI